VALRLSTDRDDVAAQYVLASAPVEAELPVHLR
jgi:hypothetical protein